MSDVFVESLRHNFASAFQRLHDALTGCPDARWETDLWPDTAPTRSIGEGALHGSAPWLLAHHVLLCLDFDLTAQFEPWDPPAPIRDFLWYADPTRVFSKDEILGYLEYCRERTRATLESLTDESAARPLPDKHRHAPARYGVYIAGIPLHLVEHATQIEQFVRPARPR